MLLLADLPWRSKLKATFWNAVSIVLFCFLCEGDSGLKQAFKNVNVVKSKKRNCSLIYVSVFVPS